MKRIVASWIVFQCLFACIAVASGSEKRGPYELFSREREVALARTAGLAPWNETASVYVLEESGYVKAVDGTSDFTCMVGRDDPGTRWPICFDAEGTSTILPRYLRETVLRMNGASKDEVEADTARRFLLGEYRAPARPGIAYMLSKDSITSNGKELLLAPPHLMIYAPHVQPEDVGAVAGHVHSPMILYPGDPHAYIVVFVRDKPAKLERIERSGS